MMEREKMSESSPSFSTSDFFNYKIIHFVDFLPETRILFACFLSDKILQINNLAI
jgi:hypothetical protein